MLLFWTVRPGDRTDNQYGELVEQAGQANPIRKLWLLAIAAVVIPLVLMMMAGVALIGMTWLGYSPATEVVEGAEYHERRLAKLQRLQLIDQTDVIEFSYAFQWLSGDEEGTILTKKKVIWYIIFDDNSDSAEMEFSHIDRFEQLREGGFAEESQYRVWGNDSAKWEYLSPSLSRGEQW